MHKQESDKSVIYKTDKEYDMLYASIRDILQHTRQKISHSVNSAVVYAYWQIGRHIVEYEQDGNERARYGDATIKVLSANLMKDFGRGFTVTNLSYMRQFYQLFPIYHTLCDKLSWSHCRSLLKVKNEDARFWYLEECVNTYSRRIYFVV